MLLKGVVTRKIREHLHATTPKRLTNSYSKILAGPPCWSDRRLRFAHLDEGRIYCTLLPLNSHAAYLKSPASATEILFPVYRGFFWVLGLRLLPRSHPSRVSRRFSRRSCFGPGGGEENCGVHRHRGQSPHSSFPYLVFSVFSSIRLVGSACMWVRCGVEWTFLALFVASCLLSAHLFPWFLQKLWSEES
jgi:hypothetical protein